MAVMTTYRTAAWFCWKIFAVSSIFSIACKTK